MLQVIVLVLILLGLIVWACALFTNAVEWLGKRFNLSEGAIGSVLAAVGTALPETIVPVIALISGASGATGVSEAEGEAIGVGAILGAPFMLATLAFALTGLTVVIARRLGKRDSLGMKLNLPLVRRDLNYFFLAYVLVFIAGLLPAPMHWFKVVLAGLLVIFYGIYVWRTLEPGEPEEALGTGEHLELEPLTFAPGGKKHEEPPTGLIVFQLVVALLALVGLAHLFVEEISKLSDMLRISALILSLVIVPIATELPEKFNSVIWLMKGKDNLAMGNITGAMVFQSCIPTAVGLIFTPWVLEGHGMVSVLCCLASAGVAYGLGLANKKWTAPVMMVGGSIAYTVFLILSFGGWLD